MVTRQVLNPLESIASQRLPRGIWCVVGLGMVLRVLALTLLWHAPLSSDAQNYCEVARRFLTGEHFLPYWPPGLPLFLAPFVAAGLKDGVLRVPMLLWWVLATWGFLRALRTLGTCAGVPLLPLATLPLLIFTIMPAAVHYSVEPLTQMPVAALLLVALSATFGGIASADGAAEMREAVLLGVAAGSMALVRPSTLPFVALLPAVVIVRRHRRWRSAAVSLVLACALLGGWLIHAHRIGGMWQINSANSQNLWYGNNPSTPDYRTWFFGSHAKLGSNEIRSYPQFESVMAQADKMPFQQRPAFFQRLAMQEITARPGVFLRRTSNRIRVFWGFDTFTALNLRGQHPRLFVPLLAEDAACYLMLTGAACFWLAARGRDFWLRSDAATYRISATAMERPSWPVWNVLLSVVLYAAPYWLSMSHPTYHFPALAPVALMGLLAYAGAGGASANGSSKGEVRQWRGWAAVTVLLAIQVEWVIRAGSSN